jgi:hypothetical protein
LIAALLGMSANYFDLLKYISAGMAQLHCGDEPGLLFVARVKLGALQSSLERRTIGLDGWPLRR